MLLATIMEKRIKKSNFIIKNSLKGGKGVFAIRAIPKDTVITEYGGIKESVKAHVPPDSHTLRIREGGGNLINGLLVSTSAERNSDGSWTIDARFRCSVGALVNAANNRSEVNAKMIWVPDDRNLLNLPSRSLLSILPKSPFLISSRDIVVGEEIYWWYKPLIDI